MSDEPRVPNRPAVISIEEARKQAEAIAQQIPTNGLAVGSAIGYSSSSLRERALELAIRGGLSGANAVEAAKIYLAFLTADNPNNPAA